MNRQQTALPARVYSKIRFPLNAEGGGTVYLSQLTTRHKCINLRTGNIRMPQHLLNVTQISTVIKHNGGSTVPEQVTGTISFEPCEGEDK